MKNCYIWNSIFHSHDFLQSSESSFIKWLNPFKMVLVHACRSFYMYIAVREDTVGSSKEVHVQTNLFNLFIHVALNQVLKTVSLIK